jgi:hypothetical protein
MRASLTGAVVAACLLPSTAAHAVLGPEEFPTRDEVASILDLDRPGKVDVTRHEVDTYFGVVPKRCDVTHHLRVGVESAQTGYWYSTPAYIISPTIEVRRYRSASLAAERMRDVRGRLKACAGRLYEDPPSVPTGGQVRIDGYAPPRIGQASFGLTSSYCCEGGPAKSRIIVSRVGATIVWTQGMNYGGTGVRMPSKAPYVRLARLAVRRAG